MGLLEALGLKPKGSKNPAATASASNASEAAPPDPNQTAFTVARAAVQKLVDALNAHPQKSRMTAEIGQANVKLTAADGHAAKKEWPEAAKRLSEAQTICTAAKKLADDWAGYAAQRANALALAMSLDSADSNQGMNFAIGRLNQADAMASASPPNFVAALAKLKEIIDGIKPALAALISDVKARLASVESANANVKAFAKTDIDQGKTFIGTADTAMAAGNWSLCLQNAMSAMRVLGPAVRLAQRRGEYETQRATTVAAIAQAKAAASVKDRAAALESLVTQADALATHDVRKFEEGARLLQSAATRATMWKNLDTTIGSATKERGTAETELVALDKHPAASKIASEREAVRKQIADAKAFASMAESAPDPALGWHSALTAANRARADLAAAKALADAMGAASAAEGAAATPGNAAAMTMALDQLVADGAGAAKTPHADQAAAAFKRFKEQSAAAATALKGKDPTKAAKPLAEAAKALAQAKTIQSGHTQFTDSLGSVEGELKALQASARAVAIKASIDAVAKALVDARTQDQAHDGPGALAALRRASDLVANAKVADRDRAGYDTEAAALATRISAISDAGEKSALEKLAANAKKQADSLAFPAADKALKQITVRLDKAKLEAAMKANPGDPDIAKIAAKMVDDGGADSVDALIQAQPGGAEVRAINALAEGRYGVKFSSGAPLAGGDPAKAMKAICATFAKFPQDVRNHPSIKGVSHDDAVGSAGGSHNFDDAKIRMQGRPGAIHQQFGANQKSQDPNTGANVAQLPGAIDAKCQPKNTDPVEYIAFATAHEVGHGVDDARGFMATHGAGEKYGGWIAYGSSVELLADVIGADARFAAFYKTAPQKQYILDKLMNKPATAPAAVAGSATDKARVAFDQWHGTATSKNVYRRQGDCDAIKIGDHIYHEAYARTWVGYLAAARSKGLTGYQFRAPGEWFAELYAGYRSGKLGDDHPAMEWLKKL